MLHDYFLVEANLEFDIFGIGRTWESLKEDVREQLILNDLPWIHHADEHHFTQSLAEVRVASLRYLDSGQWAETWGAVKKTAATYADVSRTGGKQAHDLASSLYLFKDAARVALEYLEQSRKVAGIFLELRVATNNLTSHLIEKLAPETLFDLEP